jgi:hypothetical protein
MKGIDKLLDAFLVFAEENPELIAEGINDVVAKMYAELRDFPDRIAMARLLQRGGRKHLGELKDELSLSRKLVAHREKALERIGVLSSKLDDAPEDYPAAMVRYVEITPLGERMLKYLETKEHCSSEQAGAS